MAGLLGSRPPRTLSDALVDAAAVVPPGVVTGETFGEMTAAVVHARVLRRNQTTHANAILLVSFYCVIVAADPNTVISMLRDT